MKVTLRFYYRNFRFIVVLTILSFVAWAWGWFVSKPTDGMPFARSGAVATAILIAFLVSDYAEKLEQIRLDAAAAIERSGNWTAASAGERKETDVEIKSFLDRMRAVIRYWYACLVLIATMIWGLGDYFFLLKHSAVPLTFGEIALKLIYLGGR